MLLLTCQVKVIAPYSTVKQARALLDSVATTSLISVGVAKRLRLQCRYSNSRFN